MATAALQDTGLVCPKRMIHRHHTTIVFPTPATQNYQRNLGSAGESARRGFFWQTYQAKPPIPTPHLCESTTPNSQVSRGTPNRDGEKLARQLKSLRAAIKEKDNKFNRQLLIAIERETDNLLINPHRGMQIPKKQIPKEYIIKYGVTNLWKINLPDYWRMTYTIIGNELEIISILLEFMDHKRYDKVFGYKKK